MTTGNKNVILGRYSGNAGGLDIRTASNYIVLSDGDGNPLIATYPGASVSLNGAVPQSGTGITFPATQLASSNANTLDDYEEGTWTPLVQNVSATESASAGATGTYVKVGKMVYVTINLYALNVSGITASAHLYIRGLPFEISYGNAQALFMVYPAVPVSTVDVGSFQLPLYIPNNTTDYSQFSRNSWGGASSMTLRGCFVYQSAS
jgi:hypothetical protein